MSIVSHPANKNYRDNFDETFGSKPERPNDDEPQGFYCRGCGRPICRGCGRPINPDNYLIADGCPCNSGRGINHSLVPQECCTCAFCDPAQTGSSRVRP